MIVIVKEVYSHNETDGTFTGVVEFDKYIIKTGQVLNIKNVNERAYSHGGHKRVTVYDFPDDYINDKYQFYDFKDFLFGIEQQSTCWLSLDEVELDGLLIKNTLSDELFEL